ncbi:MAG TPA: ankyrin repeat domain-containing protein [Candidatus Angelobacter sp.]|nr:ankyrin repeat domain-containing protein [Candidatus Angelobacter sp.]
MTASKSLPVRPSLESLRKQAKKLARDISADDAAALARARAHLPNVRLPLTQRNAQLVIAREYGYAGWQDLTAEVRKRLGKGLESAAQQAQRIIHDNDVERLKQLLAEHPALLSWQSDGLGAREGLLGFATGSYGDSFDPLREERFTRAACAELLIDAGAVVMPSVFEGLLSSRAKGLLQLFRRKGLLPRTLKFLTALGDLDAVRTALDASGNDPAAVTEAFTIACSFEHKAMVSLLLDRAIALDPELGAHVDGSVGRPGFAKYFIDNRPRHATEAGLWKAFVMEQVSRAVYSWSGSEASLQDPRGQSDLPAFVRLLHREPWLLGEAFVDFQTEIIGRAALHGCGEFITSLLDLDPAILRRQPPPSSQAIEFAFTYANTHVIPVLTRIWTLPDDLPHAAGIGDLSRVKQWFDDSGAPVLGDVDNHYPSSPYMPRDRVEEYARQWGPLKQQRVLDVALAWSVINSHLDVADFLLQHGADINTTWSSHEPASILHELVWHRNYEAMQFLIDRGIDMTIKDHRWNSTARGWAKYAAEDPKLAQWLEEAERQRELRR